MQTRQALLTYAKNPQQSLDYFKNRLGLVFNHERSAPGVSPNLPTALDPKSISRETLSAQSLERWKKGTDNYEESALDWMLTDTIDAGLRRHLLGRVTRPTSPTWPRSSPSISTPKNRQDSAHSNFINN